MDTLDFKGGLSFHTEQDESQFFQEFKKLLRKLHVAYRDDCCEEDYCPDVAPCTSQSDLDSFVFQQQTSALIWNITHNLGFYPNVQVIATNGTNVIGEVFYIDTNNLRITFNQTYSGTAYLS